MYITSATLILTFKAVNTLFSCRSPSIHDATVHTLDGHLKALRVVVNVGPKVSDSTEITSECVCHHQNDVCISAKLIELAQHVGEGVGDVVGLNDDLLSKC